MIADAHLRRRAAAIAKANAHKRTYPHWCMIADFFAGGGQSALYDWAEMTASANRAAAHYLRAHKANPLHADTARAAGDSITIARQVAIGAKVWGGIADAVTGYLHVIADAHEAASPHADTAPERKAA